MNIVEVKMPKVAGVIFKNFCKIYDFQINGTDPNIGDLVVVESDFGLNIGKVIKKGYLSDIKGKELKKILRIANEEDIKAAETNKALEKEALAFCVERIMARGLPMKLVTAESTLDRKRIIFYFTAEGRIDFRELVKDLAAKFKTRIEMRQIGVRDETRIIGGIGICGREVCCKTFLHAFEPVSIKMAKKQELSLNINKLSGLCGRLMCCLRYEYDGEIEDTISDEDYVEEERLFFQDEPMSKNVFTDFKKETQEPEHPNIRKSDYDKKTREKRRHFKT
jgi:cell fate regulator YaaT (PSP1 superfamily)